MKGGEIYRRLADLPGVAREISIEKENVFL